MFALFTLVWHLRAGAVENKRSKEKYFVIYIYLDIKDYGKFSQLTGEIMDKKASRDN